MLKQPLFAGFYSLWISDLQHIIVGLIRFIFRPCLIYEIYINILCNMQKVSLNGLHEAQYKHGCLVYNFLIQRSLVRVQCGISIYGSWGYCIHQCMPDLTLGPDLLITCVQFILSSTEHIVNDSTITGKFWRSRLSYRWEGNITICWIDDAELLSLLSVTACGYRVKTCNSTVLRNWIELNNILFITNISQYKWLEKDNK